MELKNDFKQVLKKQYEINSSFTIDVRDEIIGVRVGEERLRFYVDKKGRITFPKLGDKPDQRAQTFLNDIENISRLIVQTNKYFDRNPKEVSIKSVSNKYSIKTSYKKKTASKNTKQYNENYYDELTDERICENCSRDISLQPEHHYLCYSCYHDSY